MNKSTNKSQKRIRLTLIVSGVLGYLLFLSLRYDFWLDLNDDVMIRNISSGLYTGIPESHNIQMQYPLSLILSLLYRLTNMIPWYSVFLMGIQSLCLILILNRTGETIQNAKMKAAGIIVTSVMLLGLLTDHMIFYQYTVSCAFLSGTAAFLLMTAEHMGDDSEGRLRNIFTGNNITVVILLLVAYLIRSEMMLLTFPMVMLSFLFRFVYTCSADIGTAEKPHIISVFKKYLAVFITIVIGVFLMGFLNNRGYSSSEWKTFTGFFDARTELYDFQTIPSYEENRAFYTELGLPASSLKLLENYNFALDETIDAQTLTAVSEQAEKLNREAGLTTAGELKRAGAAYLNRLSHPFSNDESETDFLWKLTVLVAYMVVFLLGLKHHILWKELLLLACRSTLWLYILYRKRIPVRISHSLYFVEFMILSALLLLEIRKHILSDKEEEMRLQKMNKITAIISITTVIVFVALLPRLDRFYKAEETLRVSNTKPYDILFSCMAKRPTDFFYMDVYSWVPYTEKLFERNIFETAGNADSGHGVMNYDLMGGWVAFSPLYTKKLEHLNQTSLREALLADGFYYVQKERADLTWLENYYADAGYDIVIGHPESVGSFEIYKLSCKSAEQIETNGNTINCDSRFMCLKLSEVDQAVKIP